MLEIRHLSKRFGDKAAVHDVSLSVSSGEIVGVIGRSGAGKSTFLRLINRLENPSDGQISFGGRMVSNLSGRDLNAWRRNCAMIFQQFNLVERLDVFTNVLMGRIQGSALLPNLMKWFSEADRKLAIEALERVEILDLALQRAETLSGGQQQRVAIARALVQEPHIILADEPVAALDPVNARIVMDTLAAINREAGITVICNLHSLELARTYCRRVIGLSAGEVVFDDAPSRLDNAVLRRIYGAAFNEEVQEAAHPAPVADAVMRETAAIGVHTQSRQMSDLLS